MAGMDFRVTFHADEELLARLDRLEQQMADVQGAVNNLTAAIDAMRNRVEVDVQHLRDLVDQAAAVHADDQNEIGRLQAEADAAVDSINQATSLVASVDPDTNFPVVEPAPAEPTPEEPA